MDNDLISAALVDRRALAGLVLAAFADTGISMNTRDVWSEQRIEIDSVQRTLAALSSGYDAWGPRKVGAMVKRTEGAMHRLFAGGVPARLEREAHATYAQVLVMGANTALDTGSYGQAERTAKHAAAVAVKIGDNETAGRAWATVSASLRNAGRPHHALVAAHRARAHAGGSPAGVMALLDEALAGAQLSRVNAHIVLDAVTAAEEIHAQVVPDRWCPPGYSFGMHPAALRAYGGAALAGVGLYAEADARLTEAADILTGSRGLERAYVWLLQARVALGRGDVDAAHHFAASAVTSAEHTPAAWVARIVGELDRGSKGAFADLVERTSQWGFVAL